MTEATLEATKQTPRGRLREWFEARIEGLDEFDIADIETEAVDIFLADKEWTAAMFRRMLGAELRSLLTTMRERVTLGDTVTTKQGMKERADALNKKWGAWVEHTPSGYVRLMAMTKPQLLIAAEEREARGNVELRTAKLWRALAAELKADQRVKDHFRADQIEALERDLLVEV